MIIQTGRKECGEAESAVGGGSRQIRYVVLNEWNVGSDILRHYGGGRSAAAKGEEAEETGIGLTK